MLLFACTFRVSAQTIEMQTIIDKLTTNLASYQDKVNITTSDNSFTITFTENGQESEEPLIVKATFTLENDTLNYAYTNENDNEIALIKESLIRNLLIENVIKTVGELKGYTSEEITAFLKNLADINTQMDKQGIAITSENYDYSSIRVDDKPDENADLVLDIYLENIDNYGHGDNSFTKVVSAPKVGFLYDTDKSKCDNNSELKFLGATDGYFQIRAKGRDVCSVYFTENDLFPYELNLDEGIVHQMSINLNNFDPTYVEPDIQKNPNTGAFLPFNILAIWLLIGANLYFITKRKRKMYKI